jgi:hypothetical protein
MRLIKIFVIVLLSLIVITTNTNAEINPQESMMNLKPCKHDDTQYIIVMRSPTDQMNQAIPETFNEQVFKEVLDVFPAKRDQSVRLGMGYIFSVFMSSDESVTQSLKNFLSVAQKLDVPIVVQIDTEHWWNYRSDLWNWWDKEKPGYDPANRFNVEWTSWSSKDAIKISWRNWGSQLRVKPQPNLMSPRFLQECQEKINYYCKIVLNWHEQLPQSQKDLFVGIKIGHESSIGGNSWYYPNGNDLLDKPEKDDPQTGLVTDDVLNRGVTQIGYAAVKTAGIRSSGDITEAEIAEVVRRYVEVISKAASQAGVPREKLFTHGVGWKDGELLYDAATNEFACPGWSFYRHAGDPSKDSAVQRNLKRSDAPYWAAVEWLYVSGPWTYDNWVKTLDRNLQLDKLKFICIFNWEIIMGHKDRANVIKAINDIANGSTNN